MLYLARKNKKFIIGDLNNGEFFENYACASQNEKFIFYAKKNKIFQLCKELKDRQEIHQFKHNVDHIYTDNHIIAVNMGDRQILYDFNFKVILKAEFPNIVHEIYAMHNKLIIASDNFLKIYPKNIIYERCGQFCYIDQYLYTSYEYSLFAFCHLELILVVKIEEKIKEFYIKNNCCVIFTEKNKIFIYDLFEKSVIEIFENVNYFFYAEKKLFYFTTELKNYDLKISERNFHIQEKKIQVKKILEDFKEDDDKILPAGRTYKKRKKVIFENDQELKDLFDEDLEESINNSEEVKEVEKRPTHILFFNMTGPLIYFKNIIRFKNISFKKENILAGAFYGDNIILRTANGSFLYHLEREIKKFHSISNFDHIYKNKVFRSTDDNFLIYNIDTEQKEYLNIFNVHSVAVANKKIYICCADRTLVFFNETLTDLNFVVDKIFYSDGDDMLYYLKKSSIFSFDGTESKFIKEIKIKEGYECAIIIKDYLIAIDRSDIKCKRQYIKL